MNIRTLTYIHGLLSHDVEVRQNAKSLSWKALCDAEDAETGNIDTLRRVYDETRSAYSAAFDALEDFEDHNWN